MEKRKRGRPRKVELNAMGVPKKKVNEEPKIEEPKEEYKLSIRLGDKVYESTGVSILETLEKIETPAKIFVKGFVTVEHGDERTERMFMPTQMKRFLWPVARQLVAKALQTTLK